MERALQLHGSKVTGSAAVTTADGGGGGGGGRPIRVFRCSSGKSHARLYEAARQENKKHNKGSGEAEESKGADIGPPQPRTQLATTPTTTPTPTSIPTLAFILESNPRFRTSPVAQLSPSSQTHHNSARASAGSSA